jgi:hypothetical protein
MRKLAGLVFVILALAAGAARAQHARGPEPGGGRITLPVPRSMAPGGRTREVVRQPLQFITRNDDGAYYYSTANLERLRSSVQFVAAFVPNDLNAERRRWFNTFLKTDRAKAYGYLTYIGSLYSTEMLCARGQYRFTVGVDVNPDGVIAAEELSEDWTDWKATAGTPWEAVRERICRPSK